MEPLADTEVAVLELSVLGKTAGEISNLLYLSRTTVEYNQITCAQKLSGQSNIGRNGLMSFLAAGQKYSRSEFRRLIGNVRRARQWRNLKRNEGW